MNELMKKHKAAVAQVPHHAPPHGAVPVVLFQEPARPLSWERAPAPYLVCGKRGFVFPGQPTSMLTPFSQASRDLAQMNDLQAQLEEANKEKQELQEKVGTRVSLGRKRVQDGCMCGQAPKLTV